MYQNLLRYFPILGKLTRVSLPIDFNVNGSKGIRRLGEVAPGGNVAARISRVCFLQQAQQREGRIDPRD